MPFNRRGLDLARAVGWHESARAGAWARAGAGWRTAGVNSRRLKRGRAGGRWRVDGWRGRRTLAHWLAWLAQTRTADNGTAGADGRAG